MPNPPPKTKMVATAALFGGLMSVFKILPPPIDKMLVIIQALLFGLGSLLLGRMGATYVAVIGGLLTTVWRIGFAPFSLIFAVVYGLLVDGFFYVFKVRGPHGNVKTSRLVASLTLSTAAVGLLSTYITVLIGLMPMTSILYLIIIVAGIVEGAAGGYLAIRIARLFGARTMFIDSIANARELSMSARLSLKVADRVLCQWPRVAETTGTVPRERINPC